MEHLEMDIEASDQLHAQRQAQAAHCKSHSVAEAIDSILELREATDGRSLEPADLIHEGRRY